MSTATRYYVILSTRPRPSPAALAPSLLPSPLLARFATPSQHSDAAWPSTFPRIASHRIERVHRAYIHRGQYVRWMSAGPSIRVREARTYFCSVPCPIRSRCVNGRIRARAAPTAPVLVVHTARTRSARRLETHGPSALVLAYASRDERAAPANAVCAGRSAAVSTVWHESLPRGPSRICGASRVEPFAQMRASAAWPCPPRQHHSVTRVAARMRPAAVWIEPGARTGGKACKYTKRMPFGPLNTQIFGNLPEGTSRVLPLAFFFCTHLQHRPNCKAIHVGARYPVVVLCSFRSSLSEAQRFAVLSRSRSDL
ncbi:hypothetical protein MSAN_02439900 [Mycena sanguinolenta]|uniref:Uncharacterized protein n=1 Tax=Mycena sanguinolenta TaxID=230812 RepID=A0A8H7CBY4_9AGAR|nr:hypothetical protein MSAN_02439900 [Mycena sanguinolenta]